MRQTESSTIFRSRIFINFINGVSELNFLHFAYLFSVFPFSYTGQIEMILFKLSSWQPASTKYCRFLLSSHSVHNINSIIDLYPIVLIISHRLYNVRRRTIIFIFHSILSENSGGFFACGRRNNTSTTLLSSVA